MTDGYGSDTLGSTLGLEPFWPLCVRARDMVEFDRRATDTRHKQGGTMESSVDEAIAATPATPAGRQAAWYLARIQARGAGASLADLDRYAPAMVERMRR